MDFGTELPASSIYSTKHTAYQVSPAKAKTLAMSDFVDLLRALSTVSSDELQSLDFIIQTICNLSTPSSVILRYQFYVTNFTEK